MGEQEKGDGEKEGREVEVGKGEEEKGEERRERHRGRGLQERVEGAAGARGVSGRGTSAHGEEFSIDPAILCCHYLQHQP